KHYTSSRGGHEGKVHVLSQIRHTLSCMLKSHSLVKFSALFSGPDGRFLLVGCDSYITPLVTRTSSCFLQPRLKVNLSGGEALSIQSSASSAPRRRTHAVSRSLSLLHSLYVSHSCSHSRG
ncbi:hypothetical protein JOQ06_004352, partial [Pogonophryne albipinna]